MMDQNLAASIIVRNTNNTWIEDHMVTSCHCCGIDFGLFLRKHHCRNCGNIFCYKCSNQSIVIPNFITERPEAADYWNISYYITSLKSEEQKVCKQCYDMIKEKTKAHKKIVEIFENPVSIDKIKELSESNTDIKNYYFDNLRNIQYYLPNHRYTEIDKKLLKINAPYFSKHSKYLVHFIKSIYLHDPNNIDKDKDLEFVIGVINGDKNKECDELYCTRTCQEVLSCDDCVNILYSCSNHLPNILLQYFFDIIMRTPIDVIICHLSFFVNLIKSNSSNKLLQNLLFNLLNQSKKLVYHTFWFLMNAKENANLQEIQNINNFIKMFDKDLVERMGKDYSFFFGLIEHLNDPKQYLTTVFDRYKPISLPYEPDIQLIAVDIDKIYVKDSYTKPVKISFETDNSEYKNINILFKKESIMNDVTVLNLMTLCDIILKGSLDMNFGIVVYPTMPLSINSGMIEMVDKAETVYDIVSKNKTVFQYIIHNNQDRLAGEIIRHYMYSLVSYTLHSYFLGLGDRHLQNIMITENGCIFHIDFGFILGTDAYPLTASEIKLNSGMLDVIGGSDGELYKEYLDLCAKGVVILRKYFNMFFILLCQSTKFKEKHIERFVMSRFQPRQNDRVVIGELMSIIKQSNNAYSDYVRDFLHYHTQQKTVQNGVTNAIKTAIETVKNFKNSH